MRRQVTLSHFSNPDGFERYVEIVEEGREGELLAQLAIEIAKERGYVTADDLRYAVESLGIRLRKSYNVFGAVLASLKRRGVLRIAGYKPSEVPTSHARPIAIFVLNKEDDSNA